MVYFIVAITKVKVNLRQTKTALQNWRAVKAELRKASEVLDNKATKNCAAKAY
jgi:hypothetical protein